MGKNLRHFAEEQFDHVGQARRQPGSAFKPFVYGAAFMMGLSSTMTLIDEPVSIRLPGGEVWGAERCNGDTVAHA